MSIYDMLLSNAMLGEGGGGGGGSSDFSTAQVTITTDTTIGFDGTTFIDWIDPDALGTSSSITTEMSPKTVEFVLYKGVTYLTIYDGDFQPIDKTKVSVTGDVVIAEEDGDWWFDITGDGTITISA